MKTVIEPGDRVEVTRKSGGYERGKYKATVLKWCTNGQLSIQPDDPNQAPKNVSPDNVKLLSKK